MKLKFEFDGEKVLWWDARSDGYRYWCTNKAGEGVFFVDSEKNERRQLVGTCDFSVFGLADKRGKIRRWMNRY